MGRTDPGEAPLSLHFSALHLSAGWASVLAASATKTEDRKIEGKKTKLLSTRF